MKEAPFVKISRRIPEVEKFRFLGVVGEVFPPFIMMGWYGLGSYNMTKDKSWFKRYTRKRFRLKENHTQKVKLSHTFILFFLDLDARVKTRD